MNGKNILIAVLIGLVVILVMLYFKKHRAANEPALKYKAVDSLLRVENEALSIENDSLVKRIEILENIKSAQQILVKEIPAKYEKIRTNTYYLPADSQLRIFANWTSQVDNPGD